MQFSKNELASILVMKINFFSNLIVCKIRWNEKKLTQNHNNSREKKAKRVLDIFYGVEVYCSVRLHVKAQWKIEGSRLFCIFPQCFTYTKLDVVFIGNFPIRAKLNRYFFASNFYFVILKKEKNIKVKEIFIVLILMFM